MFMWIKFHEVWLSIGHSWLFPQYSWFLGQLSNWLGKIWNQDLKLGMDKLGSPTWSMKVILGILGQNIFVQTQTLIWVSSARRSLWADETLTGSWASRALWWEINEKWEGKFWGTTVSPVQSSWIRRVRLVDPLFVTWRGKMIEH